MDASSLDRLREFSGNEALASVISPPNNLG